MKHKWSSLIEFQFSKFREVYHLNKIVNREKISKQYYDYCSKGKYFVVIALYNETKEFFIQRNFLKFNNEWELVGGWVHPNEDIYVALDRIVQREANGVIVESVPIAYIENLFRYSNLNQIKHVGLAFVGRLKSDHFSSPNGVFVKDADSKLANIDKKILILANKIVRSKVIEPPVEEVDYIKSIRIAKAIDKYFVKPIVYNFSSKLLLDAVTQNICPSKNMYVLDVACGDDRGVLSIAQKVKLLVANDISRESVKGLMNVAQDVNVLFTNENLLSLNLSRTFDIVLCKNVMHHMRNDKEGRVMLEKISLLGNKIIVVDIEDPRKDIKANLWNKYYVHLLKDKGGRFLNFDEFQKKINRVLGNKFNLHFNRISTIKGSYMMAVAEIKS